MALLHAASITPSKAEAVAAWLPRQPWAPQGAAAAEIRLVAAFRFDDPLGEVGLETHLVSWAGTVLQVPLTYRSAPLALADGSTGGSTSGSAGGSAGESALVCTMEHSALGRRWVYDGCADPAYVQMLAALTLTGVGQAASLGIVDGRQVLRAPGVVLGGGGWTGDRLAVDGFGPPEQDDSWTVLTSPELEVRLARRPVVGAENGPHPVARLLGSWAGQDLPVTLATASLRT